MKKCLTGIFLLLSACVFSQTVKVSSEKVQLKGEAAEGFEVQLEGTFQEVQSQFNKYLKPVGKIKKGDDSDVIATPMIGGKTYNSPLYVMVRDKGKGAAWLGLKSAEWKSGYDSVKNVIEKMLYDFGVTFYRDKIQLQIDESMRALQAVERQQQKLLSQQKDFTNKLSDNKTEKIELEKSIENNKIQFEALNLKIAQNKKDQDSVAIAGEQIKKVIDMQKEKQRKVN